MTYLHAGKRFGQQKPVYVLTAPDTFSGAEDFSYTLQSHKRAKIVGETTRGGANPGDRHQISERLTIFIPNGRSISPVTKGNWEGVGVIPDIKVPAENALHTAQMLILESLLKIQKDPKQIKLLNERVHTLKSLIP